MDVSIIIINYNVKYYLAQCLESVIKAVADIEAEIMVVDNCSSDGSVDYLTPLFPQVKFIINKKNIGFGAANNQAALSASGEYLLILNPDTIIPENCLQNCLTFLRSRENAGALGVRMINGQGLFLKESKRGFPAPATAFYKISGLANIFPASTKFARYYLGHLPEKDINEVEVLAGAFMFINRKVWELIKGFDEDYFMFGEDIDLSYRIINAGYKNYYYPKVSVLHYKGASSSRNSSAFFKMFFGAMNIFAHKHLKQQISPLAYLFVKLAIKGSSFMSRINRTVNITKKSAERNSASILIIALPEYLEEVNNEKMIMQKKKAAFIFPGTADYDPHIYIGNINMLEKLSEAKQKYHLIFWKNSLSNKEMITLMDRYKSRFYYSRRSLYNVILPVGDY